MTIDPAADVLHFLGADGIHAKTLIGLLFDAVDPRLTLDEQTAALERALSMNPTTALVLALSMVVGLDAAIAPELHAQPGEVIIGLREAMIERTPSALATFRRGMGMQP